MHKAAAATMPTTMPVVLLDSLMTSDGPASSLPPALVGFAKEKKNTWLLPRAVLQRVAY